MKFFILLITLCITLTLSASFIETSFSVIESGPSNSLNIAYFYKSDVSASLNGLTVLESMTDLILNEFSDMKFYKCDGSKEENMHLYKQAGFGDEGYVYIQINDAIGIFL